MRIAYVPVNWQTPHDHCLYDVILFFVLKDLPKLSNAHLTWWCNSCHTILLCQKTTHRWKKSSFYLLAGCAVEFGFLPRFEDGLLIYTVCSKVKRVVQPGVVFQVEFIWIPENNWIYSGINEIVKLKRYRVTLESKYYEHKGPTWLIVCSIICIFQWIRRNVLKLLGYINNIKYLIKEASVFDHNYVVVYKILGGFSVVNLLEILSPILLNASVPRSS